MPLGILAHPYILYLVQTWMTTEIDVHIVPNFGIETESDTSSYIFFCKSRSANMKFYRWFLTDVFVPHVIKSTNVAWIDLCIPAYFCLDGESDQIKPMKREEVISAFAKHNIIIGKPLASTTVQTQPLDAGKIFISAKKLNRVIKSPESRKKFTNDFFLQKSSPKFQMII